MADKPNKMFALPAAPATSLTIDGCEYRLTKVFKHDFWAAACLYETDDASAEYPQIVVKFGRSHRAGIIPLRWLGRLMVGHEYAIYRRLGDMPGVPHCLGRVDATSFAMEFIADAPPLDHVDTPPDGYFDRLAAVFAAMHRKGVAYVDSNKRSNLLVRDDGQPVVIDFQISLAQPCGLWRWLAWPWTLVIRYMQGKDMYHLYKHKRRLRPDELTSEEEGLSRKRTGIHWLHRKLTKPYRSIRRKYLQKQYRSGQLESPTAELETHHQPEKESWRT